MYVRTIPTYGPKHDTRGWIRGCRGKGWSINLLKSSPDYQFIYGSNLDATPAIANFWRAFEKAQSDSIPMKLHGSFLGQGRPLKTKPWLRLASQASLSRGLKRGGQQFQGFRDDVSTHSWQQTSQVQASYMWFSPTYHASYIIYHIYIYIYTVYFHIVSYIIYSIHPPTDQIKNHNGTFSVQAKVLQLEPLLRQMWWGTNPPFAGTRDGIYDIQYQDLCDIPRCCTS